MAHVEHCARRGTATGPRCRHGSQMAFCSFSEIGSSFNKMLNLILNAVEALSGSSKTARELLIRTELDGPGGVLVAVEDSGPD